VRRPRLLQTTAVRLALKYVLAYGAVLGLALAALSWFTTRSIDRDVDRRLAEDFASLVREAGAGGAPAAIAAVERRQDGALAEGRFYLVVAPDGTKLAGNLLSWPAEEESPIEADGAVHHAWLDEDSIPGGRYEDEAWLPVVAATLADGSRLLASRAVEQVEGLHELTEYLVEILGAAVLLSLALGITLGRAILGRMDAIGRTAADIMAGDLSRRVPVGGRHDEFDALAQRLNAMLDRIQQLVRGLREVTDNIAHDLRSPLARLRNRLEVTLLEPRSDEDYRQALQRGIADAEGLIRTFNALLEIAQVEAGNHRTEWGTVDLRELAGGLAELYQPAAEENGQHFVFTAAPVGPIPGSRALLAQALGNLLENATKYTPEGGTIRLQVRPAASSVEVVVSDTGPGIPAHEREHVLERFVRLETSRHTPGSGLGLSLVQAVARLHKAVLVLDDAQPGLRVTLRFAATPPS